MSSITDILTQITAKAFVSHGASAAYGVVGISQRSDLCQFQCNGALAAAKELKKNPREIAESVKAELEAGEIIENVSVAGPGFININVSDKFLSEYTGQSAADPRCLCNEFNAGRKVIIDFGGPNVAKPMHVGHLRSTIIGDCLQRLFRFTGADVESDNHLGDWGTQMGMLIMKLKEVSPGLPYFDEDFTGPYPEHPPVGLEDLESMYPEASKECKADKAKMDNALKATHELQNGRPGYAALWTHFVNLSESGLKKDFDFLNVHFDHWLGESSYADDMKKLVDTFKEQGLAQKSEGAWVVPVSRDDDKNEVPPLLLEKSGGGFLYGTSDLATLAFRMVNFAPDEFVYVVDARQSLHFTQVFRAARKTGLVPEDVVLEHVGFGTVNGTDGKPFKTREGGVMKLSDLISMAIEKAKERMDEAGIASTYPPEEQDEIARIVGIAAVKFADLSNHRMSNYIFDIDKFTKFEGKTGPYLLYTAVRIKSILRKCDDAGISGGSIARPGEGDRKLMLALGQFPEAVHSTVTAYAPNILCDYAYAVCQEFNYFYHSCHILSEKDKDRQESWVGLCELVLCQIGTILELLGIQIPERM